jgi:hypothetical protein
MSKGFRLDPIRRLFGSFGSLWWQGLKGVEQELLLPPDCDVVDYALRPRPTGPAYEEDTGGGGASSVAELTDVDLTGLDDKFLLVYDEASLLWKVRRLVAADIPDLSATYLPLSGAGLVFDLTFKLRGTLIATSYIDLIVKGFRCSILGWAIYESTGLATVNVDIKKAAWASTPSFTSMVGGGNKPTLTSARTAEAAVSGWTSVDVNGLTTTQILRAEIGTAPAGVSDLTVTLSAQRAS